jgi:hypothetical protein
MNMHPDSVHLLVVLHDWKTPSGQLKVRNACLCGASPLM